MSLFRKKVAGAPGGKDRRRPENREMRKQYNEDEKRQARQLLDEAKQITEQNGARLRALKVQQRVLRRLG